MSAVHAKPVALDASPSESDAPLVVIDAVVLVEETRAVILPVPVMTDMLPALSSSSASVAPFTFSVTPVPRVTSEPSAIAFVVIANEPDDSVIVPVPALRDVNTRSPVAASMIS